ncbi:hypothetical protein [Streptomyces liangshanensis]|nr:hypothetical protein [Streptomyces liangshanensis]
MVTMSRASLPPSSFVAGTSVEARTLIPLLPSRGGHPVRETRRT